MKKTILTYNHIKYYLLFLIVCGSIAPSMAQCPTVTNPTQSFCDIESPTVSNLIANDNGNGIQWYDTPVSTTPLPNGQGLIDGEDYYADDNSGTCGTRQRVDVTIYGPPIGLNFQGVCVDDSDDATIADLIAIGNDIQWYNVPNGGSPLPNTTILIDNTIYYVDQSNPDSGCRTSRLSVFVNVGVVPVPTGNPIQEFCSDAQPPPTVGDLQASGNNNWYATISSATPLDLSTPLVNGQSYFATTIDPPCESEERFEVIVVLLPANDPGTNTTVDFCEDGLTSIGSINLFESLGGTPETGGSWIGPLPISNGDLGTIDVTVMDVSGSPYTFTYTVDTSPCNPSSATVTINIIPLPNAGTDGTLELCEDNA
ncbi:MAG TPA: hypothetical protein PKI08_07485, partial [Aquaticitalea sp.]|nr:hypothetical protein [Aquaticitalea sp.]